MYSKTLAERQGMFTQAIEGKHEQRVEKTVKAVRSRFRRLKQMVKYNEVNVILFRAAWTQYKVYDIGVNRDFFLN